MGIGVGSLATELPFSLPNPEKGNFLEPGRKGLIFRGSGLHLPLPLVVQLLAVSDSFVTP